MDAAKVRILSGLALIAVIVVAGAEYLAHERREPPRVTLTDTSSATTTLSDTAATSSVSDTARAGFTFDVVTDSAAQARGLGGRPDVPHGYGMLFVFPKDDFYGFWMKDMLVPIDMIWLSDNGTVLKVDADVAPSTYPYVFYPPQAVRYVLETRANEAAMQGWTVGTKIALPLQS